MSLVGRASFQVKLGSGVRLFPSLKFLGDFEMLKVCNENGTEVLSSKM